MATAAVFEIHMETNIVTVIRPKFKRRWLQPINEITFSATRLCRLQYSTASAIIRPPINISIVSFMYIWQVFSVSRMANIGKRTIGSIDVMGSGSASVTQYIDMSRTTYMHRYAFQSDVWSFSRITGRKTNGVIRTTRARQYTMMNWMNACLHDNRLALGRLLLEGRTEGEFISDGRWSDKINICNYVKAASPFSCTSCLPAIFN